MCEVPGCVHMEQMPFPFCLAPSVVRAPRSNVSVVLQFHPAGACNAKPGY